MLKPISAMLIAAAIAAVVTLLSAPSAQVAAGPLAKQDETALNACAHRPWPYLNCVGTRFGNPHIRLVTTDHLAGN
jgi:hypothetical protein